MKYLLALFTLFSAISGTVLAQPATLRGPMTTNTPFFQKWNMPIFNVASFGATPGRNYSNATNDLVRIQAAIDAACTNLNGGAVYFPPGVYGLGTNYVHPTYLTEAQPSSLIIPSNNVYLICDTPGSATLTQMVFLVNNVIGAGSDSPARGPSHIGIINLRICGKTSDSRDLTQFQFVTNVTFSGCIFENAGQDAIDVNSGNYVWISNCSFSNVVADAISSANDNTIVDGFKVVGRVGGGEMEFFTGKNTVQNGLFQETTNCMRFTSADMVNVENVTFQNPNVNATNVIVLGSSAKFQRCYFQGAGSTGASIVCNTNGQLDVIQCTFLDRGIVALSPTRLIIRNNIIQTANPSIVCQGGTVVIIDGNELNGTDGVRFTHNVATHSAIFSNNRCNASYYSDNGGTNRIVENNFFNNCEIRFTNGEGQGSQVIGNIMKGTSAELELSGSSCLVMGNVLRSVNFLDAATHDFMNNTVVSYTGNAAGKNGSRFLHSINGGIYFSSNAPSIWPTAPLSGGGAFIGNSNGVIYILTSALGVTWTATNRVDD